MPEFSGLNYINVGPHGTFNRSGNVSTTPADVDAMFAHLHASNARKLAVHFHGGLIDEDAGLDIARKMAPLYSSAGCHPVTFVWETGLGETLARNLSTLHKTSLFKKVLAYVIRYVTKHLGGGIGGKGPNEAMSIAEIDAELAKPRGFAQYDGAAKGGAGALNEAELPTVRDEIQLEAQLELSADQEFSDLTQTGFAETEFLKPEWSGQLKAGGGKGLIEIGTVAKAIATVAYKVLARYVKGKDHGVRETVVEELLRELYLADLGAWVWQGMKDVASQMWLPNAAPISSNSHIGTYFLDGLSTYQMQHPGLSVDFIGHSAGAIAICEMYKAAASRRMKLSVRNVIFLAPACRSDLFLSEIVEHPERFANFRMFTMDDAWEIQDPLVNVLYTRSLLYFISGVLEEDADTPIAGLRRYLSGESPYDAQDLLKIRAWLSQAAAKRIVLSKTGSAAAAGLASDACHHGDFDDDDLTRKSLKEILSA